MHTRYLMLDKPKGGWGVGGGEGSCSKPNVKTFETIKETKESRLNLF